MNTCDWIDITMPIRNNMVHWPGDTDIVVKRINSIGAGDDFNLTNVSFSAHTSTHMDAPLHFIDNAKDISTLPFDAVIGRAKVIEIKDNKSIKLEELKDYNIEENDRILFKTCNSLIDWSMKDFISDYVFLTTEAAKYLVEKKVKTIGIDYLSIAGLNNSEEVHKILLSSEIWIIEGLVLNSVTEGLYDLICLPINLSGSDGAPARAVVKRITGC
ncbi:MAG: cyclase family protein [Ignavibacteriaceae bacterium]